jgi:hypothetical protein
MEKAAPPAMAITGLRLAIVGGCGLMVKVVPEEFPLMSLTVMLTVPVLAIRLAGTAAVNCDALAKVVASAVVPHIAVEVEVKFVPLMVSAKPLPPAYAEAGFSEAVVGGGPTESEKLGDDELTMVVVTELEAGFEFPLEGRFVCAGIEVDPALVVALTTGIEAGAEFEVKGVDGRTVGAVAGALDVA